MEKKLLQVKISEVVQGTKWQGFQWLVCVDGDNGSGGESGATPSVHRGNSKWLQCRAGDLCRCLRGTGCLREGKWCGHSTEEQRALSCLRSFGVKGVREDRHHFRRMLEKQCPSAQSQGEDNGQKRVLSIRRFF